jgi:hypothetical protein
MRLPGLPTVGESQNAAVTGNQKNPSPETQNRLQDESKVKVNSQEVLVIRLH